MRSRAEITVHCIVKNEERWIWFAISSILDIAQKVFVYDTGSTDRTVTIIKSIKNKKIVFDQKGPVDAEKLVQLRLDQLKKTKTKWFLILDGDEIWPKETKIELIEKLSQKPNCWGVVVRAWNFIGDIYHIHPESFKYHWPFAPKNYLGWANLRVINRDIPNLNILGSYPLEAYTDKSSTPLQNKARNLLFLDNRYCHTTYLVRSSTRNDDKKILNRKNKRKYELGIRVQKNFQYPDVFYKDIPKMVQSPWGKRGIVESFISVIQTPFKELRRQRIGLYRP